MNILTTRFSTGDVIRAADVSNGNLQSWIKRGIIIGQDIDGGGGPGKHRSFSWFNLSEIASAAALMQASVSSPHDAFRASQRFSHTSDGGQSWLGDESSPKLQPYRWPGIPFHHDQGETWLYVSGDKSAVMLHKDDTVQRHKVLAALRSPLGFVSLNLTELFMQVTRRLGSDGRVALDLVYSNEAVA